MSVMKFSKANCKNCYKCVNSCSVKAIKMFQNQAQIEEDRCISCGHCLVICPQNARSIKSYKENVIDAIKSGKKVVGSIAPSFAGFFQHCPPTNLVGALKKLGFSSVEETSIGAEIVSGFYRDYIENEEYNNLITTSCPATTHLIEKYFPSLVKYLAPVVSPMVAHAKLVKKEDENSFFVFIGPCIAKLSEAEREDAKDVDAVLTFEELTEWLHEEKIDILQVEGSSFDRISGGNASLYPVMGGVINSLKGSKKHLKFITVDGSEECIEIFRSIQKNDISGVCIEANICKGGCIGGPYAAKNKTGLYNRVLKVEEYASEKEELNKEELKVPEDIDFSRTFENKKFKREIASEEEIKEILKKMGKNYIIDELNCGGCGYNSCREKAQAVYEGMSQADLCLPYIRSKAESMSNIIFENTPNIIIILDNDLTIKEINRSAEDIFKISKEDYKNKKINALLEDDFYSKTKDKNKNISRRKVYLKKFNLTVLENLVYIPDEDIFIIIMTNISKEVKNRNELQKVKENTVNAATKVIENQMRVAQEIASLLGETTSETKLILTKLKKLALEESDDL